MKKIATILACLLLSASLALGLSACAKQDFAEYENMLKNAKETTTVTIWTYYDNTQKVMFNNYVDDFNNTVGAQKKIKVEHLSLNNINALYKAVEQSARQDVGAQPMPNMFMIYSDNCLNLDTNYNCIAPLDKYFNEAELNNFVAGLLDEGRYDSENNLKIIPTMKSSEIFMMNKTAWDKFAAADTTVSLADLNTFEGITEVAAKYYDWSNGKAFFGRDAMANYIITGAKALGSELVSIQDGKAKLNMDKNSLRKLYDNFYVPYAKGHFASGQNFRSDDVKSGKIIACVCATSGAAFFPTKISVDGSDTVKEDIDVYVSELPYFKDGSKVAISQGAGVAVSKSDALHEYASVVFLKWFNKKEQAVKFSANTGYFPSQTDALDINLIKENIDTNKRMLLEPTLTKVINMTKDYTMYSSKPFSASYNVRSFINTIIQGDDKNDNLINAQELHKLILSEIDNGSTYEAACAKYLTEDHFNAWYQQIKLQLETMVS